MIGGGPNEAVISQPPTTGIFIKPERLEQSDYLWLINMYQDWNLIVGDQGSSVKRVVANIHTMETSLSGCWAASMSTDLWFFLSSKYRFLAHEPSKEGRLSERSRKDYHKEDVACEYHPLRQHLVLINDERTSSKQQPLDFA